MLSIDDTLLTHYGKKFDKIAYLYDSTQGCYVWAHNLVHLHDSDDQTDYPVSFRFIEGAAGGNFRQCLPNGCPRVSVHLYE